MVADDRARRAPYPTLPAPYDAVLREIMDELRQKAVAAILLGGSAASGRLVPMTSDLDVLVVDDGPWTIHREVRGGVEVHLTSGSEVAWRAVLQREVSGDLGANISLMGGSRPLYDPDGIGLRLIAEAQALYDRGPQLSPRWIEARRRWLTDLTRDLLQSPPESQPYLCALLVPLTVSCAFSLRGQWQPRHKDATHLLSQVNPDLYHAIERALREHSAEAYGGLRNQIGILLEPVGGWTGPLSCAGQAAGS